MAIAWTSSEFSLIPRYMAYRYFIWLLLIVIYMTFYTIPFISRSAIPNPKSHMAHIVANHKQYKDVKVWQLWKSPLRYHVWRGLVGIVTCSFLRTALANFKGISISNNRTCNTYKTKVLSVFTFIDAIKHDLFIKILLMIDIFIYAGYLIFDGVTIIRFCWKREDRVIRSDGDYYHCYNDTFM